MEFTILNGTLKSTVLVHVDENGATFGATFQAVTALHEELRPLIDYSFATFRVGEPVPARTP